jgi:ribosomal protein S18 acetylase RimI-like enzyme
MLELHPPRHIDSNLARHLSPFSVAVSLLTATKSPSLDHPDHSVRLRSLTPRDWKVVRYVAFAMAYDDLAVLSDDEELLLSKPVAQWQQVTRALAHPSNAYWVVEDDATPVASLYIRTCTPEVGEIGNVWVAPNYRRHGLAKLLIATSLRGFQARGIRAVSLNVAADNRSAQRLYRKLGFAPTGRVTPTPLGSHYLEFVVPLSSPTRPRTIRAGHPDDPSTARV